MRHGVTAFTEQARLDSRGGADPSLSAAGREQAERAADGEAAADDRDFIVRQLASLSARERAIVVLRYYADLSEAEVAATAGVSVGTVKSTCSRALARLRSRGEAAQATRSRP